MIDAAVRSLEKLIVGIVAAAMLPPLLWLGATSYAARVSVEVDGEILAKHETILLGNGDGWRRMLDVVYRYQPIDAPFPEEASHNVDRALYDQLRVGERVRIHYVPSRLLRAWDGVGSYIDGSSPWSRTRYGPLAPRDFAEPAAILGGIALGLLALRIRNVSIGIVAALVGGAAVPVALLFATAFLIGPWLFWAWWRRDDHGYGWMLVSAIALTAAIVYWRVPRPQPVSPGPQQRAIALVRQSKMVNEIWRGGDPGPSRDGGQPIGRPFQMVDIEFTPAGSLEPIHAVDRVDAGSVAGLAAGARVPISYSAVDPRGAQIVGATRTYDRTAWRYLMTMAAVSALVVTFVVSPIVERIKRLTDAVRRAVVPFG